MLTRGWETWFAKIRGNEALSRSLICSHCFPSLCRSAAILEPTQIGTASEVLLRRRALLYSVVYSGFPRSKSVFLATLCFAWQNKECVCGNIKHFADVKMDMQESRNVLTLRFKLPRWYRKLSSYLKSRISCNTLTHFRPFRLVFTEKWAKMLVLQQDFLAKHGFTFLESGVL